MVSTFWFSIAAHSWILPLVVEAWISSPRNNNKSAQYFGRHQFVYVSQLKIATKQSSFDTFLARPYGGTNHHCRYAVQTQQKEEWLPLPKLYEPEIVLDAVFTETDVINKLTQLRKRLSEQLSPTPGSTKASNDAVSFMKEEAISAVNELETALSTISKERDNEKAGRVISGTFGIVQTILNVVDTKLASTDSRVVLSGALDIMGSLSFFAGCAGPYGMVIASVMGPICSLASSLLIGPEEIEDTPAMMRRIIDDALVEYRGEELTSESFGELALMEIHLKVLTELSKTPSSAIEKHGPKGLSPVALNMISGSDFLATGAQFLGKLWYFIESDRKSGDEEKVKRGVKLLISYVEISYIQKRILTLLACIYGRAGAPILARTTLALLEENRDRDKDRMRTIIQKPANDYNDNLFYKHIHRCCEHLALVERFSRYVNAGLFEGDLVRFRWKGQKTERWLHCQDFDDGNQELNKESPVTNRPTKDPETATMFRLFRGKETNHVELFACGPGAYVMVDDHRFVQAGLSSSDSAWTLQEAQDEGKQDKKNKQKQHFLVRKSTKAGSTKAGMYFSKKHSTQQKHYRVRVIDSPIQQWESFIIEYRHL